MGFYRDPYSDFGRLTYEASRACRLVPDTGIHAFGRTRKQAIDFMMQNTALCKLRIVKEVDRYIAWPAQALAYKIGEVRIRSGPLPIDILDALVDAWIESELRNAGGQMQTPATKCADRGKQRPACGSQTRRSTDFGISPTKLRSSLHLLY